MPPADLRRLDGLRQASLNLLIECGSCGHRAVLDGPKLWRVFAIRRWAGEMDRVTEHLLCSVCRCRPAGVEATAHKPTIDPFPKDEDGWKRMAKRARD